MVKFEQVEWPKAYIFISSTFNDMHAERDYLVKNVFPRLLEWCEERKIRMVDIDLRWGVSEDDSTNRNVVKTCLKNIDKCRPFFICLLGQRRGWVPRKEDISSETYQEFSKISQYAGNASVTEMEILHALIDPFHRAKRLGFIHNKKSGFDPVQHALFYLRDNTYLDSLPSFPGLLRKTFTNEWIENQTERQIADTELKRWRERLIPATGKLVRHYSARWNPEATSPELRLPLVCPSQGDKAMESWRRQWSLAGIALQSHEREIPSSMQEEANLFNAAFTQGRLSDFKTDSQELGEVIFADLKRAIGERFHKYILAVESRGGQDGTLQRELDQQEQFLWSNSEGFIERSGDFTLLDAYAADESRKLFVLTAEAGMGKSMLLARWVDRFRGIVNPKQRESLHFRFIGQSDQSTSFYPLWRSLLQEIQQQTEKLWDEKVKDAEGREIQATAIPVDPHKLRDSLPDILQNIGSQGKTIIVLDALNQLDTGLGELNWLPDELPEGIKMIVSFKRDPDNPNAASFFESLKGRAELAEIRPFDSIKDRERLIGKYLEQYLKQLEPIYVKALLEIEASKNPLFLKIVLGELRIFGSFHNIKEKIYSDFGQDPISAFIGVLKRLETDTAHTAIATKMAVPVIFGLLAHARSGLSANELTQMLEASLEGEKRELLDSVRETVHFYLRQLRPYLARKEGRFDIFYESFRLAILGRYVKEGGEDHKSGFYKGECPHQTTDMLTLTSQAWHGILADHFHGLPLWQKQDPEVKGGSGGASEEPQADYCDHPNMRKVSEQPFHLTMSGDWARVEVTLCDLWFVEAKVRLGLVFELQEDYRLALNTLPEMESVLRDRREHQERIDNWTKAVLAHARTWSQRRERMSRGETISEPEPMLPIPPTLCRMWSQEEIDSECQRRSDHPKRLDRLKAFSEFLNTEYYAFLDFGSRVGFVLQHAFNRYPTGPVHTQATKEMGKIHTPLLLRHWSADATTNSLPALIRSLERHERAVINVSITGDGRKALSGGQDGLLCLWNLQTGRCQKILGQGMLVAMTLDGHRALSASGNRTLRVWNVKTSQNIELSEVHRESIRCLAMTPDGSLAVSGGFDQTVCLWDITSGRCLNVLEGHDAGVICVAMTPDGRRAVSGDDLGTFHVWDLASGQCVRILKNPHGGESGVSVTPDGRLALTGGGMAARLWDLDSGQCLHTLEGKHGNVSCVGLTADGRRAVIGSWKSIQVWNLENGQCLRTLNDHYRPVTCVAFSADGRELISGSKDGTLRVWNLENGQTKSTPLAHSHYVRDLDITPDGRYAVSGSWDQSLRVWEIESCQRVLIIECQTRFESVCVTPGGHTVVTGGWKAPSVPIKSPLLVWNLANGECLYAHECGDIRCDQIWSVCMTPDGQWIITGDDNGHIKVWDLESGRCLKTLEGHSAKVWCVRMMADGRHIVSGSWDMSVRVWDLDTGGCVRILSGKIEIWGVSVTPDSRYLLSAGYGTLLIWDLESGQCLGQFVGHPSCISDVVVTPNGRYAGSVGDKTLRIWDLATKECTALFYTADQLFSLAISPSGSAIVCGTIGGEVIFLEPCNLHLGMDDNPSC